MPRTGHGAASLIPHLNLVVPLEPANLDDLIRDACPPPDAPGHHIGNASPDDDLATAP
jgi:hypothetical protein